MRYSREELPKIIREVALEQIEWHKQRGDTIVVVSASIDSWLKGWCEAQHIDLIATKLEAKDGRISGRFITKNCSGSEKVRRIEERYNLSDFECVFAYGDSPGDKPMLAVADVRYYNWKRI
jgi:HAD superfamily phosphoserine phosphatase-like hydrolase